MQGSEQLDQDRREGGGSQGSYQGARGLRGPARNTVSNFLLLQISFGGIFRLAGPLNSKFKPTKLRPAGPLTSKFRPTKLRPADSLIS